MQQQRSGMQPPPGSAPPPPNPPQVQATYTIRNELNLVKSSLALVQKGQRHCIKFSFDTEAAGQCTVFFNAKEAQVGAPGNPTPTGDMLGTPFEFPKALSQSFEQNDADGLELDSLAPTQLTFDTRQSSAQTKTYPVVILLEKKLEGPDEKYASQTTFCDFVKDGTGLWGIRSLKQKITLGTASYELQEIYGIELHEKAGKDPNEDEDGSCVICMTAPRDTTVLPCRHMCLCADCAKILRFQSNKCPVCREKVASLLQIKVQNEGEAP